MHTCMIKPPVQNKKCLRSIQHSIELKSNIIIHSGVFCYALRRLAQKQEQLHFTPTVLNDKSSHQHAPLSIRAGMAHQMEAILNMSLNSVTYAAFKSSWGKKEQIDKFNSYLSRLQFLTMVGSLFLALMQQNIEQIGTFVIGLYFYISWQQQESFLVLMQQNKEMLIRCASDALCIYCAAAENHGTCSLVARACQLINQINE